MRGAVLASLASVADAGAPTLGLMPGGRFETKHDKVIIQSNLNFLNSTHDT